MKYLVKLILSYTFAFTQVAAHAFSPVVEQKIALIEQYLNSIKTFKASFVQLDRQGGISTGKFYLNRPAKMRMEYDLPNPNIIIANVNGIIHWDRELKQRTNIPATSPVAIFLKQKISFKDNTKVHNYTQAKRIIRITLSIEDRSEEVTLVFDEKPMLLRQWILKDDQGYTTEITLQGIDCSSPIDSKLFSKIE